MDTPESVNLPFWEEEKTEVLDLSTGEIFDILGRYASTVFATNRAWWNSNLTMENWMPQFMPVVDTEKCEVNDLFKMFATRFIQRNTTHDVPLRKGVELTHGLMVYKDEVLAGTFLKIPPTKDSFEYIQSTIIEDDPHFKAALVSENVIYRQLGYKYFDGERYV